jgi:hypothetical protein
MIALYTERLRAAPGEVREYRFLARAYLAAGAPEQARTTVDAGLELAADDAGGSRATTTNRPPRPDSPSRPEPIR